MTSFGSRVLQAIPDLEEIFCERFFGQRLVVDLDAFSDETKMRTGVQSDTGWQPLGVDTRF